MNIARHEHAHVAEINDPRRYDELRSLIGRKGFLNRFYRDVYRRYAACLARCPADGIALELGSGAGFVKELIPSVVTSDTIAYPGVDRVIDATRMPFEDASLRAIFMLNVFHHIPDVEAFLHEAQRCLKPGGRLLIIDQFPGWPSRWIYRYLHHEPFDMRARDWRFESSGPLSGANGALAWIVFRRDLWKFQQRYPKLKLERFEPHSPMSYWISGGLKRWTLLPGWAYPLVAALDELLVRVWRGTASFVDIEVSRRPEG